MSTKLPLDVNDNPIPALRLKNGGAHVINSGAASARNITAFDDGTRVISVFASEPVYVAFGDASVIATTSDHYFPAGLYYDMSLGGDGAPQATHIAVLQVSTAGNVYVSEKV